MNQAECLEKLKILNSMIEDYLDRLDMDGADEDMEDKKASKKKGGDK